MLKNPRHVLQVLPPTHVPAMEADLLLLHYPLAPKPTRWRELFLLRIEEAMRDRDHIGIGAEYSTAKITATPFRFQRHTIC